MSTKQRPLASTNTSNNLHANASLVSRQPIKPLWKPPPPKHPKVTSTGPPMLPATRELVSLILAVAQTASDHYLKLFVDAETQHSEKKASTKPKPAPKPKVMQFGLENNYRSSVGSPCSSNSPMSKRRNERDSGKFKENAIPHLQQQRQSQRQSQSPRRPAPIIKQRDNGQDSFCNRDELEENSAYPPAANTPRTPHTPSLSDYPYEFWGGLAGDC